MLQPGTGFQDILQAALERGLWLTDDKSPGEWRREVIEARAAERNDRVVALANGRWVLQREVRTAEGGRLCVCTDITSIKKHETDAEAARREAESARLRLRSAIDALKDGFVIWDRDDRLVVCNDAFRRQFDFLPNLAEGRSFEEMFLEFAHSGKVAEAIGREEEWVREHARQRDRELDQEILFRTHDGRWIMRRDQLTANGDRVGIRTDVTEHHQRQEELREAKEETDRILSDLHRTIDSMRMGVVVLDKDFKAEIINRAFYDIWKVSVDDVAVGSPFRALMDVNRHNGIYDVADKEWETYVATRLAEIAAGDVPPREFRRADGCTMIYSVTSLSDGRRLISYYDVTEMKGRQAELAEALEKARLAEAVMDSVPNPIFVKDENLEFVLANRAFAKIFGKTAEDIRGRRAADFVSSEEAREFEASERRVLDTGSDFEAVEDFGADGRSGTRIVRKHKVRTGSDTSYVACTIFDVSEMKRREREADQARSHLANVLDSLPAGVIIYDADDRFVMSNRQIRKSLPFMDAAMKPGKPLREAVAAAHAAGYFRESGDADLDALYDTDREAWIDGYTQRYHVKRAVHERHNPDGSWVQAYDMRTEDGTYIGVRVDITELKQRESELRQSMRENELFRRLIDNVPVAIYAKQPDLKLMYVNKGWCDLTGFTEEFALGRTDVEIFGPDGQAFMDSDREVLRLGKAVEHEETVTDPDGTVRYQIARKGMVESSDGSVYLIGSTTDITELRRRAEELKEARQKAELADRAKSEFLANMSHEIRTPMNGVLGMAELLAKTELDSKQKTFTDIIVKSGNALLTIINDILDFSKIDAGQLVLDPVPFNLTEAIEDVATLMSMRAKEKDIELLVRIAAGNAEFVRRRRRPHPANHHQSARQRHQVHRSRPRRGRRLRHACRRRHEAGGLGHRYRHRNSRRQAADHLRKVQSGRFLLHAPARGNRARPGDHVAAGGDDGRRDRRRKQGRGGLDLPLHHGPAGRAAEGVASADARRCDGRPNPYRRRQRGEPLHPVGADDVVALRFLRGTRRRGRHPGAEGGGRARHQRRLRRAGLSDARHERRRGGAGGAQHAGNCRDADRAADFGRPVVAWRPAPEPRHRCATDQAGALVTASGNTGLHDPAPPRG